MPIYQAGQMIELRILSKAGNLNFMNVLHFQIKQTPPLPTTIRETIRTTYLDSFRLPTASNVSFFAIQTRQLSNDKSELVLESFTPRTGALVTSTANEFLATVLVLRHSNTQKKPGRIYCSCPSGGEYVLGVMNENCRLRLQNVCDGLNAHFSSTGDNPYLKQVVARRINADEWSWNSVQTFDFRLVYGVQRRRRARVVI